MPRVGLTTEAVVETAVGLVDHEGEAALTLSRLASRLGVKPPSLYSHVESLEALHRLVALEALDRLVEVCREAVMGKAGNDALRSLAAAYRSFAVSHPGLYPLSQVARRGDQEYEQKTRRLLDPLLALLAGMGLTGVEAVHAARALRSALHGFALLETEAGFGLEVSVDASFEWMLRALEAGLASAAAGGS
jgi:AcrR family transcriptional regulator